jgi:hypothetical protein
MITLQQISFSQAANAKPKQQINFSQAYNAKPTTSLKLMKQNKQIAKP